jgi:hypothetical protein
MQTFEEFLKINRLLRKFQSLSSEQKEAIFLMMEGLLARSLK